MRYRWNQCPTCHQPASFCTCRTAEDALLESKAEEEIRAAMAALRENNRMVVYYAGVLGFSRAEIAASTDCPIGHVTAASRT